MSKYKVTFLPDEVELMIQENTTIMQAAAEAGIHLEGPCGGKGTCGKCRVYITGEEKKKTVLACRTPVTKELTVTIPQNEQAQFRKGEDDKSNLGVDVNPGIWQVALEVDKPQIEEQYSDLTRLYKSLGKEIPLSYTALRDLPGVLRQEGHKVTVTYTEREILALEPGEGKGQLLGLGVDIGTTTVVAALINLANGEVVGIASATNSQNIFGADVISRIEHVINFPKGLEQLQRRVARVLNTLVDELCTKAEASSKDIYKIVVAGNTTMEHLFLGIDPQYLAPAPFIPAIAHPIELEARDLGININPHGRVHLIPNIAGYVGGDTTSVILATQVYKRQGKILAVDIGTNGEMVLAVNGKMYACSTAAGPAFEGAQIKFGMRAAPGAIEGADFDSDIILKVIGDVKPTGICGSGLLQLVEVLVSIGVITPYGKMLSREEGEEEGIPAPILDRLGSDEGGRYVILSPAIGKSEAVVLTQKDVRELQLAKGAVRTGIEMLLLEAGITAEEIDEVLLAGAFGNYIDKKSALYLGLLPPKVSLDKIKTVGNAAGTGTRLALVSEPLLKEAQAIAKSVKHIELSGRQDFQNLFIDHLNFQEDDELE